MQLSEFTKLLYLVSNLNKKFHQILKYIIFSAEKEFLQVKKKLNWINDDSDNSNEMFPMKPSKLEISHSVKSYDEKTAENWRHFNDAEKRIVS